MQDQGGQPLTAGRAWFGPEQQGALEDFWRIYEANISFGEVIRGVTPEEPGLAEFATRMLGPAEEKAAALREQLRRAFAGDWPPYEAGLRELGARYARDGFTGWRALIGALSHRVIPLMVSAYHDTPERLSAALVVMAEFFDRVGQTLGDAYLTTTLALAREIEARSAAIVSASEERHRLLFEASPVPMYVFDGRSLAFLAVNDAALALYGYSREELLSMCLTDVKVEGDDVVVQAASSWSGTRSHRKRDGSVVRLAITSRPLTLEGRGGRLAVALDVTEKESLEAQLVQSQKMEAVGSLAGGVAHDFNNLLSVILSYSELIADDFRPDDPRRADLEEIRKAGTRAAALTRQLLAFSRRQVLQPKRVNLNDIVGGIERMLRRLIGEDIELTTVTAAELPAVLVDPGQIEQVIMNLAVNARDAMPRGGKLTIETALVDLDEAFAAEHVGAKVGRHVMLACSDNGAGMTRETQARIFEPFFTTKGPGKGTGLGLSTVFGIVRQSGGMIWVTSELGTGTTFKVYLPAIAPIASGVPRGSSSLPPSHRLRAPGSLETILLVEDDDGVRALVLGILTRVGYDVLQARNGGEALQIGEQHPEPIALLITDVVMPVLSGRAVAEDLVGKRPGLRVLYMSGYTDDSVVRHGILASTIDFLQKPITPDALVRKVREVLDAPARAVVALP
jgi:two-component system cell cycle sensor histidine kinase/response regulator CckA